MKKFLTVTADQKQSILAQAKVGPKVSKTPSFIPPSAEGSELFFFLVKSGTGSTYIGDVFSDKSMLPADLVHEDATGEVLNYINGVLDEGEKITVTFDYTSTDPTPINYYNILGTLLIDPATIIITGGTTPDYIADLYDGNDLIETGIKATCPAGILGTIPIGSIYDDAKFQSKDLVETIYTFSPTIFGAI